MATKLVPIRFDSIALIFEWFEWCWPTFFKHSSTCWAISSGVRCKRPWQTGHDWHVLFRTGSPNSDSESPFRLRVLARKRPCRFVRMRWNVCIYFLLSLQNTYRMNRENKNTRVPLESIKFGQFCAFKITSRPFILSCFYLWLDWVKMAITLTSQRLSGPCIMPLFGCILGFKLKLARMRCLSGPELNLYRRSNSAKKCVSSSFGDNWMPHTGHEFGGGVPNGGFFIPIPTANTNKSNEQLNIYYIYICKIIGHFQRTSSPLSWME